jgi:NAD(P)-dependent dehydrogenase (short-subunit alcohol dehydrogenase family)
MKTFLSIGSGPGMGYATAARFAREGFQIVLSARSLAKTQEQANRLKAKGYHVDVRTVDSADPESVTALINEVQEHFGTIDVLHYNAASIRKATIAEQPRATFNQDLATNVGGALVALRVTVPERVALGCEFGVGLMLVGLVLIYLLIRSYGGHLAAPAPSTTLFSNSTSRNMASASASRRSMFGAYMSPVR